ncbi:MAG: hypothetical protein P8J55_06350, partial [Pseudomonadales bacterium]|nr:hypothetical protein [Pseudomonadales bacterium]
AGKILQPDDASREAIDTLVRERQPEVVSYVDWKRIDEKEIENGEAQNRPRVKFTNVADMLAVLER